MILNPCKYLGLRAKEEHEFTLFVELVCDQIWRLRNKVLCDNMGVDPIAFVRETNKVFESHWKEHFLDLLKNVACWNPPPPVWIKVSFNATV